MPALNVSSVRWSGPSEDARHRTRHGEAVGQARKAMGSHFNRTDGSTCPHFCRQGRSPASLLLPCCFEKEKKPGPTVPAQAPKYPSTYLDCLAVGPIPTVRACPERSSSSWSLNTNNFLNCHMGRWAAGEVRPMRPCRHLRPFITRARRVSVSGASCFSALHLAASCLLLAVTQPASIQCLGRLRRRQKETSAPASVSASAPQRQLQIPAHSPTAQGPLPVPRHALPCNVMPRGSELPEQPRPASCK